MAVASVTPTTATGVWLIHGPCAIAQATVAIVAPALDITPNQGTGVGIRYLPIGGNGRGANDVHHVYRRLAIQGRTITQLAGFVTSPASDATIGQGARMPEADGDGRDAAQAFHIRRCEGTPSSVNHR